MADKLKLCVGCDHHMVGVNGHYCERTKHTSLVTGEIVYNYCDVERKDNFQACGVEGQFWEPWVSKLKQV